MKLVASSVLLLAILGESYCKIKYTVNTTTTLSGYEYRLSDTRGFKVKHDDKGYHFDPLYNETSPALKKQFYSRTVYDYFTSSGATNDSQSRSKIIVINNDTSNGTTNSNKEPNKVRFDTSAVGETITKTQTDNPVAIYPTVPSTSDIGGTPVNHKINLYPNNFPTSYENPSRVQNDPYYPSYGQMNGPPAGSMNGPSAGSMYGPPTTGPMYGSLNRPNYMPPSDSMNGVQNGQMYGPQNGQMYRPQNDQRYG